jgi:hypothetical protein
MCVHYGLTNRNLSIGDNARPVQVSCALASGEVAKGQVQAAALQFGNVEVAFVSAPPAGVHEVTCEKLPDPALGESSPLTASAAFEVVDAHPKGALGIEVVGMEEEVVWRWGGPTDMGAQPPVVRSRLRVRARTGGIPLWNVDATCTSTNTDAEVTLAGRRESSYRTVQDRSTVLEPAPAVPGEVFTITVAGAMGRHPLEGGALLMKPEELEGTEFACRARVLTRRVPALDHVEPRVLEEAAPTEVTLRGVSIEGHDLYEEARAR